MKIVVGTLLGILAFNAKAESSFGSYDGTYQVLSSTSDCGDSPKCIQRGDLIVFSSNMILSNMAVSESSTGLHRFKVKMTEYGWSEDGHFDYAKFGESSEGAFWEQSTNSGGQHVRIKAIDDERIYLLDAKVRTNPYAYIFTDRYQIVMRRLN